MLKVMQISVRADLGGGPKHLYDLMRFSPLDRILYYTAIPLGYEFSNKIAEHSKGTIEIPHRSFSFMKFIQILKICKKNDIRIIHSHGRGAGYYSRLFKFFGFKVVHTLHGAHNEKSVKGQLKVFVDRILKYYTDCFINVSINEKRIASKIKIIRPNKATVIYNGVELQKKYKIKEKESITKLVSLGRLCNQKGYDILIPYFQKYNQEQSCKLELTIIGDGEDKKELEKISNKNSQIIFYGPTTTPLKVISQFDAYINCSRHEGLPLSILEAISTGLPCLVSNVVGNNDIINNSNGYLFNLDSYEDFKSKLDSLRTEKYSKNQFAYQTLKEKFSINKQVDETISLYEKIHDKL